MSDESPIIFTDSCCTKVADLIAEENNPDLKLRVFVNGGGCSGFQLTIPKACKVPNSSFVIRTPKPPADVVRLSLYKD